MFLETSSEQQQTSPDMQIFLTLQMSWLKDGRPHDIETEGRQCTLNVTPGALA
jgi:hypothetical protein